MIDHQTAPLCFELLARFNQLLALSMNGAGLFFLFTGHTHQSQGLAIALVDQPVCGVGGR